MITHYTAFIPNREDRPWNLSVFWLAGLCTVWVILLSISALPNHQPIVFALLPLTSRVEWDHSLHRLSHISCSLWRYRKSRQNSRLAST